MFLALPSSLPTYELLAVPLAHILSQTYNCTYKCLLGETLYVQIYEKYRRDTICANLISYILSLSITSKSPFWILQNCSDSCLFGACILGNSQSEPLSPCTGLHKAGIVCCSSLKSIPLYCLSETMQSIAKLQQNHLDYFLNVRFFGLFNLDSVVINQTHRNYIKKFKLE